MVRWNLAWLIIIPVCDEPVMLDFIGFWILKPQSTKMIQVLNPPIFR